MSDKTKMRLAIACASVIGLALVIAIGMQFIKEPVKSDASSQEQVSSSDAAPEIQNNTEEKEVVVSPQPTTSEPESTETLPPQTDLPEQKLQSDPVKPEAPKNPVLPEDADTTDPSNPPEYKPEDTEKEPTAESEPQGGETKDGKVYLPGFGWVTETGGSGSTADDMYENGNKIGEMN